MAAKFALKELIGVLSAQQYFEQDDPELYLTKIRYIEENDVNDMELSFSEEEYEGGALARVSVCACVRVCVRAKSVVSCDAGPLAWVIQPVKGRVHKAK